MSRFFTKFYHWVLRLFFDNDVAVYTLKGKDVIFHNVARYKYFRLRITNLLENKPKVKRKKFKSKINVKNYAIIKTKRSVKNYNLDFLKSLLLKNIWLDFFVICRDYLLKLKEKFSKTTNLIINFKISMNKMAKRDLILAKKTSTEKEIIEIEPYSNILPIDKLINISVEKEAMDMTLFNKKQLEKMREKLAIAAKCKKYSIKVENIYGDFCKSLYSNAELQKDNKVIYKYKTEIDSEEDEQIYMFVTGKKRYDTELHSTIVPYKDLDL